MRVKGITTDKKPRRVGRILKIVTVIVGVVVCLVVGLRVETKSAPIENQITAGSCAKVSGTSTDAQVEQADCGDPQANYRVALRVNNDTDSCPGGDFASYKRAGPDGYRLCLTVNAAEGECFEDLPGSVSRKTACDVRGYRVVKIVQGTTDRLLCGRDTRAQWALIYSMPEPTTICMRELGR
ncbi:hypothetical protein OG203_19170 [Nocardia sp. NBC_01499]|uniref:LppU/SCO3897 family protein n=1 Tax=Nocardia sp. NBC_01499 TaxID=2903597 RepID=UPI00386F7815